MQLRSSTTFVALVLFLFSGALLAADASGRWIGSFTMTARDGESHPGTALLMLKQEGAVLTGTAGPNENDQKTIQHGKAEEGVITFTLEPHEGAVMRFTLKQAGDEMTGDIRGEREGEAMTAKLVVKREK